MKKNCIILSITLTTMFMMTLPVNAQDKTRAPQRTKDPVGWTRTHDASNDRGILTQRADTQPEGTITLNSYELFFLGLSYGVTDDFQLSATTLIPVFNEQPQVGLFNGKYVLSRSKHRVLSVGGNIAFTNTENGIGTFGLSLNIDQHIGNEGIVMLYGSLDVQGVFNDDKIQKEMALRINSGVSFQVGDSAKLMVEGSVPLLFSSNNDEILIDDIGPLLNYGVRFHNKLLAVDLTLVKDLNAKGSFPLGLPFVAFSAKF